MKTASQEAVFIFILAFEGQNIMSISVMNMVWGKSKQKGSELLLLLAIADNANDNGEAWPGNNLLARKCRLSTRHIKRLTHNIESMGEIAVIWRGQQGRGDSNIYYVLVGKTHDEINAIKTHVQQVTQALEKGDKMSPFLKMSDNLSPISHKGVKLSPFSSKKGDTAMSPEPDSDSDSDSDLRLEEEGNPPLLVDNHQALRGESPGLMKGIDPHIGKIVIEFADRCGSPQYLPSHKEIQAIQDLLAEEFSIDEIIAGIAKSFQKAKSPPRTLMYCVRVIRQNRAEAGINGYAKNLPTSQHSTIDADLADSAVILGSAGHRISESLLARLRLMAANADQAASAAGSTGAQWLTDALRTGLGVSKDGALLNYADSVLNTWIEHGKQHQKKTNPKRGKNAKTTTVATSASGSSRWPSDVG